VTEGDAMSAGGHPVKQAARLGLKQMALTMAAELYPHGVAAVAITPGFLRSEAMLDGFGVTEQNWRDGGKTDKNVLASESPLFIGRAVAALTADPTIMKRTGQLFSSWGLAREYGFTNVDDDTRGLLGGYECRRAAPRSLSTRRKQIAIWFQLAGTTI
jgi:NAD(P)-dependent dehydrogenase (short-subunit alcohol dehydrogenase family)